MGLHLSVCDFHTVFLEAACCINPDMCEFSTLRCLKAPGTASHPGSQHRAKRSATTVGGEAAFCRPEALSRRGAGAARLSFSRRPAFMRLLGCKEQSKGPLPTGAGLKKKGAFMKKMQNYFLDPKGRAVAETQQG